jgi:hypothetical protein
MGRKARHLFENVVAPTLTDTDVGKYLVINTETGEFEINADNYAASRRASQKRPEARTRYGARIGFRAASRNWATFPTTAKEAL